MKINLEDLLKSDVKIDSTDVYGSDYLSKCISESIINVNDNYPSDKFIMHFAEDHGAKTPVLSIGNISTTIGGAKSKKTFFSTMLTTAFIMGEKFGMIGDLMGKKMLYVDTEQSRYHVQKIMKRVLTFTKNIDALDMLSLREYPSQDLRKSIIEHNLKTNKDKYSVVIIDGLVDLVKDYNDLSECSRVVAELMSWSSLYKCHINSIVHTNKNTPHARGHLGNELMNKSETVFRVTKDDEKTSIVDNEATRNKSFTKFAFQIDDNGLPKRVEYPTGYFDNSPDKNNIDYNYFKKENSEDKNEIDYTFHEDEFLKQRDAPF